LDSFEFCPVVSLAGRAAFLGQSDFWNAIHYNVDLLQRKRYMFFYLGHMASEQALEFAVAVGFSRNNRSLFSQLIDEFPMWKRDITIDPWTVYRRIPNASYVPEDV
jgi:hypothetical protein